jgi:hypothetical protein
VEHAAAAVSMVMELRIRTTVFSQRMGGMRVGDHSLT